jgi:hypothetical protein
MEITAQQSGKLLLEGCQNSALILGYGNRTEVQPTLGGSTSCMFRLVHADLNITRSAAS